MQEDETMIQPPLTLNGVLGIINICGYNFLAGISEKQYITKIDGANIYLVKKVELMPFNNNFNTQV